MKYESFLRVNSIVFLEVRTIKKIIIIIIVKLYDKHRMYLEIEEGMIFYTEIFR